MFSQHFVDHLNSNNPNDCDLWHNELDFKFRLPTIFYLVQFLHLVVHCFFGVCCHAYSVAVQSGWNK